MTFEVNQTRSVPTGIGRVRFSTVDFLRGICVLAVVLNHINIRIRFNQSSLGRNLPDLANRVLFWNGSYAVKVFFVVSGFLITATILTRWGSLSNIDVKAFYRLRFARIVPCLAGLVVVLSAMHLGSVPGFVIAPERATLGRALLAVATFHVNWLESARGYLPPAWDILWSLSVEEAFYLAYPLLCRFVTRQWMLLVIALLLVIAGPLARTILAANPTGADYLYFANLDSITLGCAAGVLAKSRKIPPRAFPALRIIGWSVFVWIAAIRVGVAQLGLYRTRLSVTVLALATCCILLSMKSESNGARWSAPLRWLGRNSYEVYLTHEIVVMTALLAFQAMHASIDSAPLWFAGIIAASALLGYVVAKYYSEPLNRRLRSLPVKPTAPNDLALGAHG